MSKYFDIFSSSTIQIGDEIEGGKVVYLIDSCTVVVEYKLPCDRSNGSICRLKLVKV